MDYILLDTFQHFFFENPPLDKPVCAYYYTKQPFIR